MRLTRAAMFVELTQALTALGAELADDVDECSHDRAIGRLIRTSTDGLISILGDSPFAHLTDGDRAALNALVVQLQEARQEDPT